MIEMSSGQLLPAQYQRRVLSENFLGTGSQTVFVTSDLELYDMDSTEFVEAIQVFVGGILQTSGYDILNTVPISIRFDTAPPSGYQVSIQIQQARVMYNQGPGTASDGIPLQETNSPAADFIRGY